MYQVGNSIACKNVELNDKSNCIVKEMVETALDNSLELYDAVPLEQTTKPQ